MGFGQGVLTIQAWQSRNDVRGGGVGGGGGGVYGVFVQMTKLAFSYWGWESVHML